MYLFSEYPRYFMALLFTSKKRKKLLKCITRLLIVYEWQRLSELSWQSDNSQLKWIHLLPCQTGFKILTHCENNKLDLGSNNL